MTTHTPSFQRCAGGGVCWEAIKAFIPIMSLLQVQISRIKVHIYIKDLRVFNAR